MALLHKSLPATGRLEALVKPCARRPKYKTTNWASYNAALKARGSLAIWRDRNMQWLATPNGKPNRQRTFS